MTDHDRPDNRHSPKAPKRKRGNGGNGDSPKHDDGNNTPYIPLSVIEEGARRLGGTPPMRDPNKIWEDFRAEKEAERQLYELEWLSDVEVKLTEPCIIQGWLPKGGMSVVYGDSNCGKSFYCVAQDIHIGAGLPFFDRDVEQGIVLYFAMEGRGRINNRMVAYRDHILDGRPSHFAVISTQVDMLDPYADTPRIINQIRSIEDKKGLPVVKITLDTLARALPGNENSGEDMGALVRNSDKIREQTETHVQWIHHTGKDAAKGARGHSSLRAATDTEIEITDNAGTRVVTCLKQRDLAIPGQVSFTLRRVVLGHGPKGEVIDTCVMEPGDAPKEARQRRKMTNPERIVFQVIDELLVELPPAGLVDTQSTLRPGQFVARMTEVRTICSKKVLSESGHKPDSQRRAFDRAMTGLQAKDFIVVFDNWVWLRTSSDN